MTITYWGPHFPDYGGGHFWDTHFPDGALPSGTFPGYGPPGSATFVLDLQSGFSVTFKWDTDIIPRRDGTEQRISTDDACGLVFTGMAVLDESLPRQTRSRLAKYAALGSTFLLGLPHEELTIVSESTSEVVNVSPGALALCDWAQPGQRVVVYGLDGSTVDGIVQSTTSSTITLDTALGDTGKVGARIMPAMAMLLEPQQPIERYPKNAEVWKITARSVVFDFAPTLASLALGPLSTSASLDGAVVRSRLFGLQGNQISFALDGDPSYPAAGELVEGILGTPIVVFRFQPGVTTFQDLIDALGVSSYVVLSGVTNPTATIQAGDELGDVLSGGTDSGLAGTGASLTTYDSRPVWDRPIQLDERGTDSVHAMTDIIDVGGVPYAVPNADAPDWGRHILLRRQLGAEWQWFKLLMYTVIGRQKSFWLPTYRHDMTYDSHAGTSLTVRNDDGADFFAWWPEQRQHVQVVQNDGTITRAEIIDATDNADGTVTLTIDSALSASGVSSISWLELCRFESDDITVTFTNGKFSVQTVARVVRE